MASATPALYYVFSLFFSIAGVILFDSLLMAVASV
jgi:hypothetical protein